MTGQNKFFKLNFSIVSEVFYIFLAQCLEYILMVGHQFITSPWKLRILEPVSLPIPAYRLRQNHTTRQLLSSPLQIL